MLPIAGADLVLGATWLKTLGHNIVDYDAISVKCIVNDHFVTLQREKPSTPSHASYHHIKRLSKSNAIQEIFTLQLHQLDTITDNWLDLPENMDLELALLLHTYKMVFDKLSGLPLDCP